MDKNSTSSKKVTKLENVLIVGSGGRENSLAWAIQKNELVKKSLFNSWQCRIRENK